MVNWEERRQMVKVANLYYFSGWTQAQIAKKMGVSRPVISKLLSRAKELGIVEIYIKDENAQSVELENQLESIFSINKVIVVPSRDLSDEMVKKNIGKAAASYLSKQIPSIKKLGISWGVSLSHLVNEYPYERHTDLKIVPLVGGMGNKLVEIHSNLLAYQLSKKLSSPCSYLYAPAMVESVELKERLCQASDLAAVLQEGREVDAAIVGIGNPYQKSTMIEMNYLTDEDLFSLRNAGVVGDIASRFYNVLGEEVSHPLNNRVIGISLEELKKIPTVIGIVDGMHKKDSVEAALRGNYLDTLIIDDYTAYRLVEEKNR